MSEFEFVIVLMSFIVAFGASELLSGWGRVYLARATISPYPLQLTASVLLFVALFQSVWGYWGFRSVSWGFESFFVALLPLLPLVGAAGIILPRTEDLTSERGPEQHYQSICGAIFILLAMWIALGALTEIVLIDLSFHLGQVVRLVGIVLLVGLSLTSKPAFHWLGMVLLAILQLAFVRSVTPTLG